jgi:membrane protein required for colicin V production
MPILDILIIVAIASSVIIGIVRGFVKEAISIAALLVAIWAAMFFGPGIGEISDSWIASQDLRMWFGRILVFVVILSIGGLLGWGISKLVRLSVLSGVDRLAGAMFGAGRGILLVAVFIIGGEFAGLNTENWWQRSILIPHLEVVAEWIKVMAPQGYEILVPEQDMI